MTGKLDDLGTRGPVFPSDFSHAGKGPEEDIRRECPVKSALRADHEKHAAPKLPFRRFFHQHRLYSLTHAHTLSESTTERAEAGIRNINARLTEESE